MRLTGREWLVNYLIALITAGRREVLSTEAYSAGDAAGYPRSSIRSSVMRTGLVAATEPVSNKGGARGGNDSLWILVSPEEAAA
ncbi:hypothetical protein [Tsukamurella pseudospumae]|uniref:Uncharacterized protein n=1 Tax=Tsukamurella pseudospumae TaxID=239498 RepID=A0A138ABP9_9ACTN|nr:hypothetical protein [Tsukamurella pseudospumae]KXP07834.1 hypothetical protein AXK60_09425 [Tsukamurella pseudospumae]